MSQPVKLLLGAMLLALTSYTCWWWLNNMERRSVAVPRQSAEAGHNPLLAAGWFLEKQGIRVRTVDMVAENLASLSQADVLLLPYRSAQQPAREITTLWRWVLDGGVLITGTLRQKDGEDPLLLRLGVTRESGQKTKDAPGHVQPPGSSRQLTFETNFAGRLRQTAESSFARWQDQGGEYLRAFAVGKGQIVVVGETDWFSNRGLQKRDHAELLWRLVLLKGEPRQVLIVSLLKMPPWYIRFWKKTPLGWLSLALLLTLLFWHAVRRFGPIRPEADPSRRSLLEHIDACGRWFWHVDGGPFRLLQAARLALRQRMLARMPEWTRLPPQELAKRLARRFNLSTAEVDRALNQPVRKNPHDFTARLRILQFLRKKL